MVSNIYIHTYHHLYSDEITPVTTKNILMSTSYALLEIKIMEGYTQIISLLGSVF